MPPNVPEPQALLAFRNIILQRILADEPLTQVLAFMVEQLEAQEPGLRGSVLLLEEEGQCLRPGAAPSLPPTYCAAIDGLKIGPSVGSCGTAAYRGQPVFVGDISQDPLWANFRALAAAHGLAACWSSPILSHGRVLGTFALYWAAPRSGLSAQLHHFVEAATGLAGLAIESTRRQNQLQALHNSLLRAEAEAHMGRWFIDLHGGRSWWSPQMWALLELTPENGQPSLDTLLNLLEPDERVALQQSTDRMFRGLPHQPLTLRVRSASGAGRRYLLLPSCAAVQDAQGRLIGYEGTILDITASKLGEEQLHQQLQELRRWQQITLGRESRVRELKSEVNALLARLGEAPRYTSVLNPQELA